MIRDDFSRLLQAAQSFSTEHNSDTVLFLGHPSDPIPRTLIVDKDLSLAARIVWCFFRQRSDSPDSPGTAPNYDTIQKELSIGGRGTVAAAVHELRVTRWITLIPQPAHHRRKIYWLHNTPLTFNQAVELDPDYPNRIAEAIRSPSRIVRTRAQRILDGAMASAQSGDLNSEVFRLAAYAAPEPGKNDSRGGSLLSPYMFQRSDSGQEDPENHLQPEEPLPAELDFHGGVFGLSPAMEDLARIKLNSVPAEFRQAMLDELAVRVIEREKGNDPVRHPLGYLSWMINQYIHKGDLPLSGRGDKLSEIIEQIGRVERDEFEKPLRQELDRLNAEMEHHKRTLSYLESQSKKPDEGLVENIHRTERKIRELRSQLSEGANGAS